MSEDGEELFHEDVYVNTVFSKSINFGLELLTLPQSTEHGVPFLALKVLKSYSEFFVLSEFLFVQGCEFILGEFTDNIVNVGSEVASAKSVSGPFNSLTDSF